MSKRVKLDPTDLQSHSRAALLPVNDVLERLEMRAKGFENLDVSRVSDLGIHWSDQDTQHSESGWYAKINGRDMILSQQAVRTGSKLIGQADSRHWLKYPDRNAFPTALAHILENEATNGSRREPKRLVVRHDGIKVRAMLPFSYKIRDSYNLLADFIEMITENVGEVQGVSVIEADDFDPHAEPGDITSCRVVVGSNIMPSLQPQFGQYMMFLMANSETGAMNAVTGLGLFRTTCLNSAIRNQIMCSWGHKGGLEEFYDATAERIQQIGYYQDQYANIFGELLSSKLEVPSRDLLHGFHSEKLITTGHFDAAEMYVDAPTEDGRPVETQYDLFNALTRAAQDLPTYAQRQQAEATTLHLFTEPGGIFERLRNAALDRARGKAMRRGQDITGE